MSIIADALKKAQGHHHSPQKAGGVAKPKSPEIAPLKPETKKRPRRGFYVLAGLAIVILLLFATFLFFYATQDGPRSAIRENKPTPSVAKSAVTGVRQETDKSLSPPENTEAANNNAFPPGRPAVSTLLDVNNEVKLNGIMYTPDRPLAVINDNIWTEGESVGSFKIVEIKKDFVRLQAGGQEFVIRLKR